MKRFVLLGTVLLWVLSGCGGGGSGNSGDTTPPSVVSVSPLGGATGVALSSTISVTFSEAMDTSTITTASFTLDNGATGSLAFSSGDTVATFTPSVSLHNGTTYTVSLGSSITDLAGNALTATSFSFIAVDWQGTKEWGAAGAITPPTGIATDNNGNVYAVGLTTGGIDGNVLAGNSDMYLIKYNAIGSREWLRQLGVTGGMIQGTGVATDSSGNIFVTGNTDVGLNGNSLVGLRDALLMKYDSAGLLQWTLQIGSAGKYTNGKAVAVDSSGYVYLAASAEGSIDGHAMSGTGGTYLAKFDTNGIKQWSLIKSQSGCNVEPRAMSVDSSGNILISGKTNCNLDGQTLQGSEDSFVMKYDASQVWQWTRLAGVPDYQSNIGIAVADPNAIYLVGFTTGNVTIDGVTSSGNYDSLLVKFDGSGNRVWTRLTGTADTAAFTYKGAVDASGNIYLTGETWGAQAGNTATGNADHLLIKYDASGNLLWVRQDGAVGGEAYGFGVAIDPDGNAFITGEALLAGLDGNTLIGNDDGFIAKYAPDGTKQ